MMKKGKKSLSEKLIYNNKFVMLVSVTLAIAIWVSVKINYSTDITRVVSDVRISLNTSMLSETGYKYFVDDEQLYVDVEISGKAYDINSNVISKDDIIVTATETFVDFAGNKQLSLNARIEGGNGSAQIVSVMPSSITVYYDREVTDTFRAEPRLTNDEETLINEDYLLSGLFVSDNMVEVTGPESVLSQIETVYFTSTVDDSVLPLTKSVSLESQVEYKFKGTVDPGLLRWLKVEGETPKVNVVVKAIKNIPTAIKYINNPSAYKPGDDNVRIDPENVIILASAESSSTSYLVHTINFTELSNKKNEFEYTLSEVQSKEKLSDESITSFKVTIDFSELSSKKFKPEHCDVIFVGENEGYDYDFDFSTFENEEIIVIGPKDSLSEISAKDIKIEIDVENLIQARNSKKDIEISNISIVSEQKADCWVYGSYTATVTATVKPVVQVDVTPEAVPAA